MGAPPKARPHVRKNPRISEIVDRLFSRRPRQPFRRSLRVLRVITLVALLALGVPWTVADTLSLEVSCDRTRIYLGESVLLTVRVAGRTDAPEPDLSSLRPARYRLRDSQAQNIQQIVWVNGRLQRTGFVGRIFTYEVTPTAEGIFRTGPIRVTADGRTVTAEGPPVEVTGVEAQDWVRVQIRASRENVLVEEPFEIVLSVRIREPEGAIAGSSPFDPSAPPHLQAEYLDGEVLSGLMGPNLREDLQRRILSDRRMPGFTINRYTVRRDPFDMDRFFRFDFGRPFEEEPARFRLDETHGIDTGGRYVEYTLSYSYTPREQGSYTFGPAVFKGEVLTAVTSRGAPERRRIFAVGPAVTVRVVPPPEEGRPTTFVGAVGRDVRVDASLDTESCRVGDRLQLKVTIAGAVNPANVWPPDLTAQGALTNDFRLYEETVRSATVEDRREFAYTLRPIQSGTLEIPPIEVAYYDLNARAYRTVRARPLPLVVRPAAELTAEAIISGAPTGGDASVSVSLPRTLAPMTVDPSGADSVPWPLTPRQGMTLAVGPAVYGTVLASGFLVRAGRRLHQIRRRRTVFKTACRALRRVPRSSSEALPSQCRQTWTAVRRYVADRLGVAESGLTPADVRDRLLARGWPPDQVDRLSKSLEAFFNAAFTSDLPSREVLSELSREAESRLAELEARGWNGATAAGAGALLPLVLLLGLAMGAAPANGESLSGTRFLWEEANRRLAIATTPEEALQAARAYQPLVQAGVRNGPLFYNLGTALLRANHPIEAQAALWRAERYLGTTPEIRRNLEMARAVLEGDPEARLPGYRALFAWHYGVPFSTRVWIAVSGWTLAWMALGVRRFHASRLGRSVFILGLALLMLYGSSAVLTWHQERLDDALGTGLVPESPGKPQSVSP